MKTLLCTVPDGSLDSHHAYVPLIPRAEGTRPPPMPLGLIRVLHSMEKEGFKGDIYDINNLRHTDEQIIKNLKDYNPDVVGLSGPLSHCYPHMKRIINIVKDLLPKAWIVVGGNISGSANVLLQKTFTDVCVVGDGEIAFNKLLNYIKINPDREQINYIEFNKIPGLAFLDENNKFKLTGFAEQIPADEMEYPNYDRLMDGLERFGGDRELVHEIFDNAEKLGDVFALKIQDSHKTPEILEIHQNIKHGKVARIQTSKGCVAKCTFCQRAIKGYRIFGPNLLEDRLKELKQKHNVTALSIDDENFGSNRKQAYECAKVLKKLGLYWSAEGARAKSISVEDLEFYKKNNMLAIRYGIESGSQTILDIMEKKTTTEKVYEQIATCKRLGIATASEVFMLGMPGETRETVLETATFAARLRYLLEDNWNTEYPAWATAIPGTPLYEYAQQIGVIGKTPEEEEEYLIRTADEVEEHGILNYLNKTEFPIRELHYWLFLYRYAGKKAYVDEVYKQNKSIKNLLSQLYNKCIKVAFQGFVIDYRRKNIKNLKFKKKLSLLSIATVKLLFSLSIPILPKFIFYRILKVLSDIEFNILEKKHRVKNGRQKYNLFVKSKLQKSQSESLIYSQDRIAKTTRTIERSLRTIVRLNKEKINATMSEEDLDLDLLAKQQ